MNIERILEIFKETGVMLDGHFLYTSGRHGDKYMQCAQLFRFPHYTDEILTDLAKRFENDKIDLVIGPAIGAIQMSYAMARILGCENIFAERENGKMTLRRGFHIEPGQKVLVVEDVVTTGGSVMEVLDLVRQAGGEVVAVCVVVDRTNGKLDLGTRLESAVSLDLKSYAPEECPLCKEGIPFVKPGSRALPTK
ncbi:MAG: orotate phosphoribosyltransferase [Clostridiales bacterium]|nr:orotate phosphoribosyltransferase [Clostridiales bacterium]